MHTKKKKTQVTEGNKLPAHLSYANLSLFTLALQTVYWAPYSGYYDLSTEVDYIYKVNSMDNACMYWHFCDFLHFHQVIDARKADPRTFPIGENPYAIRYAVYNIQETEVIRGVIKAFNEDVGETISNTLERKYERSSLQ